MITKKDLEELYQWAKKSEFPLKQAPTVEGYANKTISYCWLKGVGKTVMIRKKLMNDIVSKIYENGDILFSMISVFHEDTELKPHRDPNVYREPYKRIQIPLVIPDKEKCYMIWRGEKIYWSEGDPKVFEVMDYIHEGYNYSDSPMIFLFIDVKKSTEVELINN
jgi:aspartyl/asparaginyl beta-hydroxylase (cupin superfamily)